MTDTVKFLLALLIVTVIIGVLVSIGMFGHRIGQVTPYETQINSVLESQGGFTNKADSRINSINKKFVNKSVYFQVQPASADEDKSLTYGSRIPYNVTFKIPILSVPTFGGTIGGLPYRHQFVGVTTSKVSPTHQYDNEGTEQPDTHM